MSVSSASASSALLSFSGVGSGLPVSQIIEALMGVERQPVDRLYEDQTALQSSKTTLNTLGSKITSMRTAVEKFTDSNIASVFDIFSKRTSSSSDSAIATATASNNAIIQNVKLKVNHLATATTATSMNDPGKVITGDELVKNLGNGSAVVTTEDDDGKTIGTTFSIYVDNKKYTINVDATTTLDKSSDSNSIVSQINTATGGLLTAKVTDGKFEIDVNNTAENHDIKLGSSSDTCNFLNVMQLNTKVAVLDGEGNPIEGSTNYITSDNEISSIYTAGIVVGENASANLSTTVTAGTFTIGKATFTITEYNSLADVISRINSDDDAGVIATFDARSNTMKLTSTDPGATSINLSNGSSNFLAAMGLTVYNPGQADDNTLAEGSQTLGTNASFDLNGRTIEANTNTVGSDVTGLSGVTINLKGTTPTNTGGSTTATLKIEQDTTVIVDAVNSFLTKFNDFCTEIDKDTASTGSLKSDYSLIRLKNEMRTSLMNSVQGLSEYDSLGIVGVSTGSIGTSVDTKTNTLSLDRSKFLEALNDNASDIKALLIGDSSRGITGIFQNLKTKLDSALDPESGYIHTKQNSINTRLTTLAKSIADGELRLQAKKETLTQQYNLMDQLISNMKSQAQNSYGIY
ncbi:MAG: flagellar filament capping protein FliD [Candidatus Gastranaerophilales bacterium]|nr:flagellar filament capping protein FliD [Candidatus Gastranaerophilales bacterium]